MKMNQLELMWMWQAIFACGRGLTYLLAMGSMIKYLLT